MRNVRLLLTNLLTNPFVDICDQDRSSVLWGVHNHTLYFITPAERGSVLEDTDTLSVADTARGNLAMG